jgi:PAS domain S-box-containing protein
VLGAAVLGWLAAGAVAAAEPPPPPEPSAVLLIYADPRLLPAVVGMDQTLRATIESRTASPVRFYTEYLDLSWFPENRESHVGHTIRQKYAGRRFDLVVPCGESALRFALRERDVLFPGVPIVFCTVEDSRLAEMNLPADVTGVTMFRDWEGGLDLILRLHPATRRIVFVSGAGAVERGWERLAREAFARNERRLTFTYLAGQPIRDTMAAFGALGEGDVVVFNILLRDGAGRTFSSPEALALLSPAARVPIYGFAETQIGHGIVGGVLVSYEDQARRAGELATRVLAGERLGPADVVRRAPNAYVFDARQLERWRIRDDQLPAGSVVRFRETGAWQRYKWQALGALGFVAAQSLLVIGLLAERRQKARARRRLDERLRFEMLVADLAAGFIEVPAGEVDARIERGLGRITEEIGADRAGLAEFTAAGDELRVTHVRARDGISPPPPVFTREAWPWTLGQIVAGQPVCFARLADLPPEAVVDRRSFLARGTKSLVIVPVLVSGTVVGGLGCAATQREREWPAELVQRMRLLADVFAVVLVRRRAEQAIAESEGRFHLMADAAPVMMWVAGPDGRCIDFNRAWLDFTGRALAEEIGDGWLEGVHPEDREPCMGHYLTALAARQPFTMEYRLRRADGVYRAVLDNGAPRFAAGETFRGYVGSATDITEVKAAQQSLAAMQREREELAHALRVATLGELTSSIAHELNQPLTAIVTNAQAAQRSLAVARVTGEIPETLADITADGLRAAGIIRRLRALFKKEPTERRPVDIGEVVKEVLGFLHKDLDRRGVKLDVKLQPDAPRVLGDVVQLQQVMVNVLVNAAEAMADSADARELSIEARVHEPGRIAITVRDSGPGVAVADLERIFERFVTSKREGLGMGLSISRSIVAEHGGKMWATRNADRGLTLHVELPSLEP